jgi:hypothetical protein
MALDLTSDPQPAFAAETGVGTDCTQIRGPAFTSVVVYATGAVYLFNGVAEGGTVAASTARKALTATQAAAGAVLVLGGPVAGQSYATVCIAAQTGTVDVEAYTVPPERVAP